MSAQAAGVGASANQMKPELTKVDLHPELQELAAESIGWIPLGEGVYLHVSDANANEVLVVGVPKAGDAVLLVV